MKLVEILARELKEWPLGAYGCVQDADGSMDVKFYSNQIWSLEIDSHDIWTGYGWGMEHWVNPGVEAEDAKTAKVTRAQWEAERARILAESQPDRDEFIKEIVDTAYGKRSQYEQELWDRAYEGAWHHAMKSCDPNDVTQEMFAHMTECAAVIADAFMAERAKRLKQ